MTSSQAADYTGARGSNAGDQFHQYWALEQVLELLRPGTNLKAVTVEGVASEAPGPDQPKWDGVDCGLYFGGMTLETADALDLEQLKYSSSDPDKAWTVARLTYNSATKTDNSVICRLAHMFAKAKPRAKPGAKIRIRLISNQPASDELKNAVAARWTGKVAGAGLDAEVTKHLQSMQTASRLSEEDFAEFVSLFDLSGTGQESRFSTKARVISKITGALGGAASVAGGGKFGNGAVTAAFGYLFNQAARNGFGIPASFSPEAHQAQQMGDEANRQASQMSLIVGGGVTAAAGPGGLDASGALYWNPIAGEAGWFASPGATSGINIGLDRFFGFVFGPPTALEGQTINQNLSVGPLALTTFHDPQTLAFLGGTIGVGWGRYPIGYSTSFNTTHTVCVTCR